MKTTRLLVLAIFILWALNANVGPLFAEAPLTPKILFSSFRDGNYEVYIMNPDGSEQVNLTQHPADDLQAIWSPTGEKILFVSDREGIRDLYMMNPDGSNIRRVFKFKIEARRVGPTWSPDGKQIVYEQINLNNFTFGMYMATLGDQDEELIGSYASAAWSPDGTEIACTIAGVRGTWIVFLNVRTQKHQRFLPKEALQWQAGPCWSATGDKLAFSGNNHPLPIRLDRFAHDVWADKYTVYIVNRDGTGLKQLVEEDGPAAMVTALSPNGEEVLYTQDVNKHRRIFKVDVNTGIRTQLTHVDLPPFQANTRADWFDPAYTLPVSPQPTLLTTTWGELKKEAPDGRK